VKTTYTWERRLDTPTVKLKKKEAYGIEAEAVDGMNLMAVIDAADTAVQSEKYWKIIYWFAIPIVLRHSMLMPNYIGTKRD
jgi:hypothetical protein